MPDTIQTSVYRGGQSGMATQALLTTTPVTLSIAQAQSRILKFTGAITTAITVNIPALQAADAGMWWIIDNATTNGGGATVTIKAVVAGSASTGTSIDVAKKVIIYFDGTDVKELTAEL